MSNYLLSLHVNFAARNSSLKNNVSNQSSHAGITLKKGRMIYFNCRAACIVNHSLTSAEKLFWKEG